MNQQPARKSMVVKSLVGMLVLVVVGGGAFWSLNCPCERIPGGYLLGDEVTEVVSDWEFANQVPLCQLEVQVGFLPHSINLNCMATETGDLYLSCSRCEGKRWSSAVGVMTEARLKLDNLVYPVTVTRIKDPDELERAWRSRLSKLRQLRGNSVDISAVRPEHWWTFRLESS